MAKYLDQAGVQRLTEALVQNTKTVGGQSIWGSGNIDTSGVAIHDITDPMQINFDTDTVDFYRLAYSGDQAPHDTYIGYALWDDADRKQLILTGVTSHKQYIVEASDTVIWNEITQGSHVYTISNANDLQDVIGDLASYEPKTVLIEASSSARMDIGSTDLIIHNAQITGNLRVTTTGNIWLDNCRMGIKNIDDTNGSGLTHESILSFTANKIYIFGCYLCFAHDPLNGSGRSFNATDSITIHASDLNILPLNYNYYTSYADTYPNITSPSVIIRGSKCTGLIPSNDTKIEFGTMCPTYITAIPVICNEMMCCNFSNITSRNNFASYGGISSVLNTKFVGCIFPSTLTNTISNVTQSVIPSGSANFYAGPDVNWPATEYGFNKTRS